MARSKDKSYRKVDELPKGAQTVRTFCDERGWTNVQNFYNYKNAKTGDKLPEVEIIIFQGINYVVTKKPENNSSC